MWKFSFEGKILYRDKLAQLNKLTPLHGKSLACGDLNCSYWGGLKLRKLVINTWVFVFPRIVLGDGGMVVGPWNDMYLFEAFLLRGSNVKNWSDHQKEEFLRKFCGTDGLIETVKYIWVNILYMLDWIFSQNCRNSLPLHTAACQLAAKSTKYQMLLCLTNCLQSTPTLVYIR